jgi:hypothetical protein
MTMALLPAALMGVALSGCASADGVTQEISASSREENLYLEGTKWPSSTISVCYDSLDGNNPTLLAEAKRVLAATWSRATPLTFKGRSSTGGLQDAWGPCDYSSTNYNNYSIIALHFCDGSSTSSKCPAALYDGGVRKANAFRGVADKLGPRPHQTTYLQYGVAYTAGVTNVSLIQDETSVYQPRFRYQVAHEFGHALGFGHEMDRPDSVGICTDGAKATTPSSTDYLGTAYDGNSIMNYCAGDGLAGTFLTNPSGADVYGARQGYQRLASSHGFMILSDADPTLAVNAYGGAVEGGALKLNRACTISNPDCTWTYQRGMLVSDKDPTLAIKMSITSSGKGILRLAKAALDDEPVGTYDCTPQNSDCTWTWRNGQFENDHRPNNHMNAHGGAVDLADVVPSTACTATNNSCNWTMPNVMLTSARNVTLPVNALGGAAHGNPMKLHNACTTSNGSCTYTFKKGMVKPTGNLNLGMNALYGASEGSATQLHQSCAENNVACTWTWSHGQLISDDKANGTFALRARKDGLGARHLTDLVMSACGSTNVDCVFDGLFAKN